jgi:hypothetical protein
MSQDGTVQPRPASHGSNRHPPTCWTADHRVCGAQIPAATGVGKWPTAWSSTRSSPNTRNRSSGLDPVRRRATGAGSWRVACGGGVLEAVLRRFQPPGPRLALLVFPLALVVALGACTGGADTGRNGADASRGGEGSTGHSVLTRQEAAACGLVSGQVKSGRIGGNRMVFGVVSVPPFHLPQRPVQVREGPWHYWNKAGLFIRAGSPPVVITVPQSWRHRAAITWGNNVGIVSTLRLVSCPQPRGTWNAYAGGFYLRSAAACVPLVFRVGQQSRSVRFGIGRHCGK